MRPGAVPIDHRVWIAARQTDGEVGRLWVALVVQAGRHTRRYSADEYNRLYPWIAPSALLVCPGDQRICSYQLQPFPANRPVRGGSWRGLSFGWSRDEWAQRTGFFFIHE